MPKQYSLDSMMDDVLREVEAQPSMEKQASVSEGPKGTTALSQYILKVASELKTLESDVTYEDLNQFLFGE